MKSFIIFLMTLAVAMALPAPALVPKDQIGDIFGPPQCTLATCEDASTDLADSDVNVSKYYK